MTANGIGFNIQYALQLPTSNSHNDLASHFVPNDKIIVHFTQHCGVFGDFQSIAALGALEWINVTMVGQDGTKEATERVDAFK